MSSIDSTIFADKLGIQAPILVEKDYYAIQLLKSPEKAILYTQIKMASKIFKSIIQEQVPHAGAGNEL